MPRLVKFIETADVFPEAKFQGLLRTTGSFATIMDNTVDHDTIEFICTPKATGVTLDDTFLKNMLMLQKKADFIGSINFDSKDKKIHFMFTRRSFL